MLFGKLLPREGNFFELFNEHGEIILHLVELRARLDLFAEEPGVHQQPVDATGDRERNGWPAITFESDARAVGVLVVEEDHAVFGALIADRCPGVVGIPHAVILSCSRMRGHAVRR